MKCEFKYVVHDQINVFTKHTLKEMLIMAPMSIITFLFLCWCDFEMNILWLMLIIAIGLNLCLSMVGAIKYCKSMKG